MKNSRISSAVTAFHTTCRHLEAGRVYRARRTAERIPPFDQVLRLVLDESYLTAEEIAEKVWGARDCGPLRWRAVERMTEAVRGTFF